MKWLSWLFAAVTLIGVAILTVPAAAQQEVLDRLEKSPRQLEWAYIEAPGHRKVRT